jgi:hypothetical protein
MGSSEPPIDESLSPVFRLSGMASALTFAESSDHSPQPLLPAIDGTLPYIFPLIGVTPNA